MNGEPPLLLLASGSPRRKDLLEEAGYRFEVFPPQVEEVEDHTIDIRALTAMNARLKADAVAGRFQSRVVLAADTLVLLDDCPLGKPGDMDEASEMLQRLNGRTHQVYTAVCLARTISDQQVEFDVVTEVTFRNLGEEERRRYHELIDPLDKAGAYAAQDHGQLIIEKTVGSMTNVIGLPMDEVERELRHHFDIEPTK